MIILDTNVVSEVMNRRRAIGAVQWLPPYPKDDVFTTAISLAEVLAGIAFSRRDAVKLISEAADKIFATVFPQRVLPFDERRPVRLPNRYGSAEEGSYLRRAGRSNRGHCQIARHDDCYAQGE